MSKRGLEPMDADLAALLDIERAAQPPTAALARVWDRVATAGQTPAPRHESWLASHALPVALTAFVLGGVAGAGLETKLGAQPRERVVRVYVPAPPTPAPGETPAPALAPVSSVPSPAASAVSASPRAAAPAASAAASSLSAERLLLDQARTALGAGDPDRALSLLSEHSHRFPRPQLGEEREALAVGALAAAGRYDEARERGARFRTSMPNSLFLPAVDATLASIP
jgi:hypothetical protein